MTADALRQLGRLCRQCQGDVISTADFYSSLEGLLVPLAFPPTPADLVALVASIPASVRSGFPAWAADVRRLDFTTVGWLPAGGRVWADEEIREAGERDVARLREWVNLLEPVLSPAPEARA